MLRVAVGADGPAVAGDYAIVDGTLRFTPMFPLDPGRSYQAVFDASAVPGAAPGATQKVTRLLTMPAEAPSAPTTVAAIYPSADTVPANLLRMYVEFSGPMGSRGGQDYLTIEDAGHQEIPGALLPLDTGLWSTDHTRFTVLFDPGRVKRGILPNRRMGRPLKSGDTFALLVRAGWPDARGVPVAAPSRREYRVGPAIERPLDPQAWTITAPKAGSREPLIVAFPWPLDRALLQRTVTVERGDAPVAGDSTIQDGERRWLFTPRDPWQSGPHTIVARPELEDIAGNRVGHAFETRDSADDTRRPPARLAFMPGR